MENLLGENLTVYLKRTPNINKLQESQSPVRRD